jgi:hypothetical protein
MAMIQAPAVMRSLSQMVTFLVILEDVQAKVPRPLPKFFTPWTCKVRQIKASLPAFIPKLNILSALVGRQSLTLK